MGIKQMPLHHNEHLSDEQTFAVACRLPWHRRTLVRRSSPVRSSSPELVWTFRSDLYSLGVVLWEMLTGRVVFRGTPAEVMYQHLHAPLPVEQLEDVPKPVVVPLEALLEKDSADCLSPEAMFLVERRISLSWIEHGQTRMSTSSPSLLGLGSESRRWSTIGSGGWPLIIIVLQSLFLVGLSTDRAPAVNLPPMNSLMRL
jgi:serine/threonine protein kinase